MTITKNTGPLQISPNPNVNIVTEQPTQEPYPNKANTLKSTRPKKETKHYGDTTNLDFLDSSHDYEPRHKRRAASVASYSTPKTTTRDTPASPARSTIPVASSSHSNTVSGPPPQPQDETHIAYSDINDADQSEEENERHLQPREL